MAGGGTTTQTATKNEPWAGAQPFLSDVMGQSRSLYSTGAGTHPYDGPFVAGIDPMLQTSMTGIANRAQNTDTTQPWNYANATIGSRGITPDMGGALGTLGAVGGGQRGIDTGGLFNALYGQAGGQNQGPADVMARIAGGNPIDTAGLYGGVANRAQGNNADVIGGLGQIAMGPSVPGTGQLQGLYEGSRDQNAGSIQDLSNPGQIGTGGTYGDVAGRAFGQAPGMSRLPQINTGRAYGGAADQFFGQASNVGQAPQIGTGGAYGAAADRFFGQAPGIGALNSGPNASLGLAGMANGSEADNPHLQQMLAANDRRISDRVNSTFSGMGRYGSAGHTDVLGRSLAEADAPVLAQAYESAKGRQLAAAGQMDSAERAREQNVLAGRGLGLQSQQLGLGALAGQTGVEGQNATNTLAGRGLGLQSQGLGLNALAGQTGAQGQNISNLIAGRGQGLQAQQLGLAALGGQTGVEQQNIGNRMAGASSAAGIRQGDLSQGAGILGQVANAENAGVANRLNAGLGIAGLRNQNLGTELNALGGMTGAQGQNAGIQLNAAGGLGNLNQGDLAQRLAAAQGLTGVQGANINNQVGASTAQLGAYGQGIDRSTQLAALSPQLNALSYDQYQQMAALGNFGQGRAQQQLQGNIDLQNQMNLMPWTQLGRYSTGVAGLAGLIPQTGSSTGFGQQQQQPGWNQLAGLGIAGLGLLCDRGRKTDIEELGVDPDTGLMLYAFRYASDPKTYPKVVGPMADEVAAKYPGAVRRIGDISIITGEVN